MPKARVYELAKELGVDSKTVLEKLKDMGEFVKSASSTVETPVARRLKEAFPKANADSAAAPAAKNNASAAKPQPKKPAAPATHASETSAKPAAPKPSGARPTAAKPGQRPGPRRNAQSEAPRGGQRSASPRANGGPRPGPQNTNRNERSNARPNAPTPGPRTPRGPQGNGQQGGGAKPGAPQQHAPRPGNNPFSRKQGMHTPTPGDIPRPHPMARPTVNDSRRGGRPGARGGARNGRPGPGTGARPGQWGQHRQNQGGGANSGRPGGNRFGGGNSGGFQNNNNGPSRGGGRGRGGAAGAFGRQGGKSSKARKNRLAKRHEYEEMKAPVIGGVRIPKGNGQTIKLRQGSSLADLAEKINVNPAALVTVLFHLGEMATATQSLDEATFQILGDEIGWNIKVVSAEEEDKELLQQFDIDLESEELQEDEDLKPRPPVVTVMGHVDHGKTSLLDHIRNANVVSGEAGGITQHIGAYQVEVNGKPITFLDTPGHEAFTAMRARGAMVTDIAILVVAADDGIMPQTVESINHAKAAEIPIIVAINKMDKPEANPDRIKQQLTEYELVPEEWGGETIICPISAKTGMGIDNLLEMVTLTAEMRELKANPNRTAHGAVIEARLDKGRGPVATLLVQNGTLKQGDVIIAGMAVGRVRAMTDYRGNKVTEAGPSVPVEIIGMGEVPGAGDDFHAVADERMARELVEQRKSEMKNATTGAAKQKVSLEELFSQIQAGEMKDLNVIVKADVQGSAEAVKASLEKISNEEVRVRVIHCAVGAVNESDVMLATTSNAIIVGFNVRPDKNAAESAARNKVDMRMYRVIYDCINEIESAMKGMLAPKFKEVALGEAEVRQVYKITGVGFVAGCYVTEGKVARNAQIRLVRDGIVIHEGVMNSLQRFKDSVKEVARGYECGIGIEKYSDIKEGDVIEAFVMEQVEV